MKHHNTHKREGKAGRWVQKSVFRWGGMASHWKHSMNNQCNTLHDFIFVHYTIHTSDNIYTLAWSIIRRGAYAAS